VADLAISQNPLHEVNPPLVLGKPTYHSVTKQVSEIIEGKTPKRWYIAIAITGSLTIMLKSMIVYLVANGIGVWGNNRPVFWGWDITNFVFWIGIGHAGTLISAILFLFRQKWRTSINRAAEAMTLFAVACAGIYPLFHTGRPWRAAYWLFPIPNTDITMWQNFRSPLMWDVFAVSTYATVSALFWFVGLIPDFATIRDRAVNKVRKTIFGVLSLGWRGSARHWRHYEAGYLILAGISTPLVLSVHSVVSFDFATSVIPGWHTTIFPPYFVAGAIYSGFGMVLTLLVPLRKLCKLEDIITMRHIDIMCKVTLATGCIVSYAYSMEFFIAWYSGSAMEQFHFMNRALGPYQWAWIPMMSCNMILPQLFWFKKIRQNLFIVFIMSILVNVGMWFERFVIIVVSLHRDFLPSSWGYFKPTWVDVCTYIGTFGLFFTCFLLFMRFLPMIAISEVKGVTPQSDPHHPLGGAKHEEVVVGDEGDVEL
jgi:Ni/Fe-hydrogenase subunit HybB-like protein